VDVVVVGAGITGVTTAWLLQQAGCSVALIDRDRIGAADTGHTTAHLTYVTDTRLHELVRRFGQDAARMVWEAGASAIDRIHSILRDSGVSCDFRRVPGYLHLPLGQADVAVSREETVRLQEDADLAAGFGMEARFVERVPHHAVPGVFFGGQAAFDPGRYLEGLVSRLASEGCAIFEETALESVEKDPRRVVTDRGNEIRCSYLVIATHNPLSGSLGAVRSNLFQTKLSLYTTYVVGARLPVDALPDALFWDTADPYDYLRIEPRQDHQLVIMGGADVKTGQGDDEQAFRALEQRLVARVPGAVITQRWLGQVIETDDGLPYIGEHADREFIATGFAGNGFTFGTLAAGMACDAFFGRANPWIDLFRVDRKPFHGGMARYVRENLDYPTQLVRDRLRTPRADTLTDVPTGEGRILTLEGQKCAVFRGDDGNMSVCSAVCTHLKCLVRWNAADQTWDCPCHGSRFSPDGEVLSGPAQRSLQRIELEAPKS
jgi:glycine/D-amino acid oxidase-like deaminating enzyme/nitrite reductase/ring-hydroxylating ferredoxin subunit